MNPKHLHEKVNIIGELVDDWLDIFSQLWAVNAPQLKLLKFSKAFSDSSKKTTPCYLQRIYHIIYLWGCLGGALTFFYIASTDTYGIAGTYCTVHACSKKSHSSLYSVAASVFHILFSSQIKNNWQLIMWIVAFSISKNIYPVTLDLNFTYCSN